MPVLTKINTNSIAEDAITGDKFAGDAYLANTATQNISGTYSENRLYTSDAYTLSGNATVNSHLTLSSVKPNSDVVLTTDSTTRTITGTGVLSGGSLLAKHSSLSGMTGELSSSVTGGSGLNGSPALNLKNATQFPAGSIINVYWSYSLDSSVRASTDYTTDGNSIYLTPKSNRSTFLIHHKGDGYWDSGNDFSVVLTLFRHITDSPTATPSRSEAEDIGHLVTNRNVTHGNTSGQPVLDSAYYAIGGLGDMGFSAGFQVYDKPDTTNKVGYFVESRSTSGSGGYRYPHYQTYISILELEGINHEVIA